jgi:uncharacterized protein YlxP (DUF503 family)
VLLLDLRLPHCRSLKEKRAVVRPILEAARRRCSVAAAEVDHQQLRQRAGIGMAAVAASASHVVALLDQAERLVWANPEVEVIAQERTWVEVPG